MKWSILLGLIATAGILAYAEGTRAKPYQPANMPTLGDVRAIMADCERMNPGERCIFVAMVVPKYKSGGE